MIGYVDYKFSLPSEDYHRLYKLTEWVQDLHELHVDDCPFPPHFVQEATTVAAVAQINIFLRHNRIMYGHTVRFESHGDSHYLAAIITTDDPELDVFWFTIEEV